MREVRILNTSVRASTLISYRSGSLNMGGNGSESLSPRNSLILSRLNVSCKIWKIIWECRTMTTESFCLVDSTMRLHPILHHGYGRCWQICIGHTIAACKNTSDVNFIGTDLAMGKAHGPRFPNYYHALNRYRWSSFAASRFYLLLALGSWLLGFAQLPQPLTAFAHAPRRFTHCAFASGGSINPPSRTLPITAFDHLLRLCRKSRRLNNSTSSKSFSFCSGCLSSLSIKPPFAFRSREVKLVFNSK